MKAHHEKKYSLPRWGIVAISALMVIAIVGSGAWSASAAPPAPRSDGRDAPADTQYFQDVPSGDPFFGYVNTLFLEGIINGYPCGGPGEPCVPPNLPYYRPGGNLTRAQMAKIINTSQNLSTEAIVSPFKIVTNAARGVAVWGGTGGSGPSHSVTDINAGLYGNATGLANSVGLLAVALHDNAAVFSSSAASSYSILVPNNGADIERGASGPTDALYVNGHITITGGCTGCALDEVMMNTGTTDLHPGDVVALGALAPEGTTVNGNPVAGVSTSSVAYDTGVVGVVGLRYTPGDPNAPMGTMQRTGGRDDNSKVVKPGEYMTVITQGVYKLVKVDTGKDGIHAGDLLTTGGSAGAAMKATDKVASIGALLGKAMGNLDSGVGYVPVLVTLK
jgi:hypothetical protein